MACEVRVHGIRSTRYDHLVFSIYCHTHIMHVAYIYTLPNKYID